MAELTVEGRDEFLQDMKTFLDEADEFLKDLLKRVGWNIDDLPKLIENAAEFESCPLNGEHRIPVDSLEAHIAKCIRRHGKYPEASKDDLASSIQGASDTAANESKSLDLTAQKSSDDNSTSQAQSSSSQRLVELLSAERDAKRRRAAYRKKRVHTNKKSYNEILCELIENEMKTLEGCTNANDNSDSQTKSKIVTDEKVVKSFTYAGVGNWIFHGNPYKRWMTIEDEERDFFKATEHSLKSQSNSSRKRSAPSVRHSDERRVDHHRRSAHVDKRSHSSRDHNRYYDSRHERDRRSRRSSRSPENRSLKKGTRRRYPSPEHKKFQHSESPRRTSDKFNERVESTTSSRKKEYESSSKCHPSAADAARNPNNSCVEEKPNECEKEKSCKKIFEQSQDSSSVSGEEKKRHKKKHKKHSKKKKHKQRSKGKKKERHHSSESSS